MHTCPAGTYCGHPLEYDIPLSRDFVTNNSAIDYGYINFDNIGNGILTVFTIITLEGWAKLMYNLFDSRGYIIAMFLFVSLVLFGAFFLLNLILAVLMDNFDDAKMIDEE